MADNIIEPRIQNHFLKIFRMKIVGDEVILILKRNSKADRRWSVIPRGPCCSLSQAVAGNHRHLRLGEMRLPALPSGLTGCFDEENDPTETPGSLEQQGLSPGKIHDFTPRTR